MLADAHKSHVIVTLIAVIIVYKNMRVFYLKICFDPVDIIRKYKKCWWLEFFGQIFDRGRVVLKRAGSISGVVYIIPPSYVKTNRL